MTKHVGRIFYSLVFSLIVLSVVILGACFSIALYHLIKTAFELVSEIIPHGPVAIGVIFCYLFVVTVVGIYREETDLLDNFDNWRQRD